MSPTKVHLSSLGHNKTYKNLQTPQHSTHAAEQILYQKFFEFQLKDNIPLEKKSEIYQINCKKIYIIKTKRDFRNIENGEIEKSAVAAYVWKEKCALDYKPILLKQAANKLGKYPYNKKLRSHYKF